MTSQNTVLYTPFADGRTVRDIVEHSPALVSEAWCRRILQQVLQSLEQQYASHAPHRIVSPDSVVVLESGEALLLPSPDGLASDEADSAGDIHALALVIHYAISAEDPPDGPLGPRLYDDYSAQLTETIDRCLGPNLRLRPKSTGELRALLGLKADAALDAPRGDQQAAQMPAPQPGEAPLASSAVPAAPAADMPLEPVTAGERDTAASLAPEPTPVPAPMPAPVSMPAPPEPRLARPIAATPLKPSAHPAPAQAAPAPAAAPMAARPKPNPPPPAARQQKSGVERWAMIAGAAIVLLAAGSALYAHLNQDSSDDVLAASLPGQGTTQAQAAQGLDAGEAVVAPAADATFQGADGGAAAPTVATAGGADAAAMPPGAAPTAPGARHADAVVNGTTYKLLIKPWGTVYVNGVDRGVSPPVKRLTLGQGEHTIRIVNPNFAEHVMTVNAGSAESATIEHDFTAQAAGGQ